MVLVGNREMNEPQLSLSSANKKLGQRNCLIWMITGILLLLVICWLGFLQGKNQDIWLVRDYLNINMTV